MVKRCHAKEWNKVSLQSFQLKGRKKILDWAPDNWHKLKEANKVKIWCKIYDKAVPSEVKISGEMDMRFFDLSESDLDKEEAKILERFEARSGASAN